MSVEMDLQKIEAMVNHLKVADRFKLLRRLERKAWPERFRALTAKIDRRRKKAPVSKKELLKLVKQARQERYAAGRS